MPRNFSLKAAGPSNPRSVIRLVLGVLAAANLVAGYFVLRPLGGSSQELRQQASEMTAQIRQQQSALDRTRLLAGKIGIGRGEATLGDCHLDEGSPGDEAIDDPRRAVGLAGKGAFGADQPVVGDVEGALARRRHALGSRRAVGAPDAEAGLNALEQRRGADHHAHDHAERGERVARHPLGEAQRRDRQRRHVGEHARHHLQLAACGALVRSRKRRVPDDADARLCAERHEHEGAGGGGAAIAQQVVVGLVERDRQQHRHPGAGRCRILCIEQTEKIAHVNPQGSAIRP